MKLFEGLIGNEKLKKTLACDIFSETNSHAYILEGPEGSGKHTVAYLASAALFCENKSAASFPCGKCSACKKVLNRVCTDVIVVNKGEKATLSVEVIREQIKAGLSYAPTEMERKVYIIEEADKMTPEAQNSLLLSLEEPPPFVTFFLLCRDSSDLLETVKSRAPIIKTELFSNEFVTNYLKGRSDFAQLVKDAKKFDYAVTASHGSLGKAVTLLTSESTEGEELRDICKNTIAALCTSSVLAKLDAVEAFPSQRSDVLDMLEQIRTATRDLLAVKRHRAPSLLFYTDKDEALKLASKVSVKKLIEIEEAAAEAESDLSSNLNISAVLTLFASKIK